MLVVAEMSLREVARRRGVLFLLVLLPLAFYLARHDLTGQSIRLLSLGLGWAVSTLTLFTSCAARSVEPRLRIGGFSSWRLLGGRLLAMTTCGLVLAAADFALVLVDQDVARPWAVGLLLLTTVLVAVPVGALLAALVPRELEGALALLTLLATQMLMDPAGASARLLPFWSTRELGTYAVDATGPDYLVRGLAHAALTWTLTLAGAAAITAVRLRVARWPEPPGIPTGGIVASPGGHT
jgi:hypothetical protein